MNIIISSVCFFYCISGHVCRRFYSLKLDGDSMQEHIKKMTEIFGELAVVVDTISDVVHLLASLLNSYYVLVTVLESNTTVTQIDVVIERLLHEEEKQKIRSSSEDETKNDAFMMNHDKSHSEDKSQTKGKTQMLLL